MDTPSRTPGGLWNNARPIAYSKETQDLLKLLMQESHLNIQKRQIRECLKNGSPLHLACASKPSPSSTQKQNKVVTHRLPSKPQRRSAEMCRAGDSYIREKFRPGPTRDLEKEKRRLQNILEIGKVAHTVSIPQNPSNADVPEEMDPFQKILDEIEERRQFLEDMSSLGQEQQYVNIINTEISQRIRELELMNKSSSLTKEGVTSERNKDGAEDVQDKLD